MNTIFFTYERSPYVNGVYDLDLVEDELTKELGFEIPWISPENKDQRIILGFEKEILTSEQLVTLHLKFKRY